MVKTIKKYLTLHLKIALEYKISFLLMVIGQFLSILLELIAVYSLFDKFQLLNEYNIYELFLGFSIIWMGESLAEIFGKGFDSFAKIIKNGKFDILLIRPENIFLQIIGTDIAYNKLGKIIPALILIIVSYINLVHSITIYNLMLIIFMILSSFILFLSILINGASLCFYTTESLEIINIFLHGSKQLGQYPMNIYNKFIRIVFTIIIPLSIVNYFPMLYLTNKSTNILLVFCPLITIIYLTISILIFNIGIKHYTSTGS